MELFAPRPFRRIIRKTLHAKCRKKHKEALRAPLPQLLPPVLHAHEDFYPYYPEDWINVTDEASQEYLLTTDLTNVAWQTTYALAETNSLAMQNAPTVFKKTIWQSETLTRNCMNM